MNTNTITHFRQIGKGFCGSVWAPDRPGPASAFKREDGGPGRSLAKDSTMHKTIEASLAATQSLYGLAKDLNIPKHLGYIPWSDHEWWENNAANFPSNYQACNTLITERIPPLAKDARHQLIDHFCKQESREAIKNSRKDEDCLVRPYIGRRRQNFSCPSKYFTLRNKPLLSNQLEGLGLPIDDYAPLMADALAVLHWHAKVDANDIEFVLAPPRQNEKAYDSQTIGPHRVWILDFDCVNPITLDDAGIEQAARAFFKNDPFYPRPDGEHETDRRLWEVFTTRFLESSAIILGQSRLPVQLVMRLEELGHERHNKLSRLRADGNAEVEAMG